MKSILGIAVLLFGLQTAFADETIQKCVRLSYTVGGADNSGSAIMVTRKRGKDNIHFLWTAAHVVAGNQQVRRGLTLTTMERYEVAYFDAHVLQEIVQNGRKVGSQMYYGEIVRLSSHLLDEDIALLKLRATNLTDETTEFDDTIPKVGQHIFHIGSIHGLPATNSYSEGVVAFVGRVRSRDRIFDQGSIIATSGSSGCGVYWPNGKCAGIVLEQQVPHVIYYRPTRELRKWAKKYNCLWAMDSSVPLPSDEEILREK